MNCITAVFSKNAIWRRFRELEREFISGLWDGAGKRARSACEGRFASLRIQLQMQRDEALRALLNAVTAATKLGADARLQ
jgi:hypothetical protein